MKIQKAEKRQARIKMALQGPSGSGKTYSSLLLAYGLSGNWDEIAIMDTENYSAHLYSNLGGYNVLTLPAPFTPERYIQAMEECEKAGAKVIIIDSISHEWEGQGGILEVHSSMAGNSFTNWNKLTPRHNAFVQRILQSSCHIIATIRTKQDYVLSEKNGKYVPEKVGLKGVTRDGLDYEFTLVFDLDIKHYASVSKDRTGVFDGAPPFVVTPATGEKILSWCLSDSLVKRIKNQIDQASTSQDLRNILIKYPTLREDIEPLCVARNRELQTIPEDNTVKPKTETT
ncbi:MAG TPA: AAA family ATPase [Bacteroidetes bacterium]|nr:AAA family ATPase [Bacteroidota bacterium]